MVMVKQGFFMSQSKASDWFTFQLDAIAQFAIGSNDHLFVRETGLSILEVRLLRMIDDDPGTSFVEIKQRIPVERSKVSRMLQRLLGLGLIRRENSREDARKFRLYTAQEGAMLKARSEVLSDRPEALLLASLRTDEVASLNALLERVRGWVMSADYAGRLSEVAGWPAGQSLQGDGLV